MIDHDDPPLRHVAIWLCVPCINGEGSECHSPGCALFLHRVDLPIHEEILTDIPAPPTAQPPPVLDLDALAEAERAMTPGPWRHGSVERHHVFCGEGDRSLLCPEAGRVLLRMNEHFPHGGDAAGIVALRNAATALIAEVRALRRHYDAAGPDHNLLALLDLYHEREQAALAKLAEAKRMIADLAEWLPQRCDVEAAEDVEALDDVKRRLAALEAL